MHRQSPSFASHPQRAAKKKKTIVAAITDGNRRLLCSLLTFGLMCRDHGFSCQAHSLPDGSVKKTNKFLATIFFLQSHCNVAENLTSRRHRHFIFSPFLTVPDHQGGKGKFLRKNQRNPQLPVLSSSIRSRTMAKILNNWHIFRAGGFHTCAGSGDFAFLKFSILDPFIRWPCVTTIVIKQDARGTRMAF